VKRLPPLPALFENDFGHFHSRAAGFVVQAGHFTGLFFHTGANWNG
jgi:hypothetical protein